MISNENLDNLSDELKEKAKACKTVEELAELAASEGVELTTDQLEAIAGGKGWKGCSDHKCGVPNYR